MDSRDRQHSSGNIWSISLGGVGVLSNDGEDSTDRRSNRGAPGGWMDCEFEVRHTTATASHADRVSYCSGEDDTTRRRGEENEQSDTEGGPDEGSDELSDELAHTLSGKEVTRPKITGHTRGLGGRSGQKDKPVDTLKVGQRSDPCQSVPQYHRK